MATKEQLLQLLKDSVILGVPLPDGFESMLLDAEKTEIIQELSSQEIQDEESISTDHQSVIMDKDVDWSVLNYGFTIPKMYHQAFIQQSGQSLERGHSVTVNISFEGKLYPGTLRFPNLRGRDVVQLLWKGKDLLSTLRSLYSETYEFMSSAKADNQSKKQIALPEELKRKLIICSVKDKGIYLFLDKPKT